MRTMRPSNLGKKRLLASCFMVVILIMVVLTPASYAQTQTMQFEYYGVDTCLYCVEVKGLLAQTQDWLGEHYPNVTPVVVEVNTAGAEGTRKLRKTAERFDIAPVIPLVVVDDGLALSGLDEIKAFLQEDSLNEYLLLGAEGVSSQTRSPVAITIPVILLAGFLDGLNPCALAMLMFLLSYVMAVGMHGDDYKQILYVGWIYAVATFLTYFVVGAGLMNFLLRLAFLPIALRVVYGLTVVFCLVLAYLNMADYISLRKGNLAAVRTQLPKRLKHLIHRLVRNRVSAKSLYVTTFFVSILISLIDFLCTGQIYLPTLTFMLSTSHDQGMLYLYLGLYNLMFTLPIILVFYGVYATKTVLSASEILTLHLKYIKLAGAVFYSLIGLWVGYMFVRIF